MPAWRRRRRRRKRCGCKEEEKKENEEERKIQFKPSRGQIGLVRLSVWVAYNKQPPPLVCSCILTKKTAFPEIPKFTGAKGPLYFTFASEFTAISPFLPFVQKEKVLFLHTHTHNKQYTFFLIRVVGQSESNSFSLCRDPKKG